MIALRAWSRPDAQALREGSVGPAAGLRWHEEYPMAETFGAVQMLLGAHGFALRPDDDPAGEPAWWIWQVVEDGLVVGDIGFHGPPPADGPVTVEIGYNVVPAVRGRGVATRACVLLLEQAWRDGAQLVLAGTEPGNVASQRVLRKIGMQQEGLLRSHMLIRGHREGSLLFAAVD